MAIIATNTPHVPFVDFDEQSRVFKFEYGTQLIEYSFMLSSEISAPSFLGDLTSSIEGNTFADFLKQSIDSYALHPTGENGILSDPLYLAITVPVDQLKQVAE
jgi:hypothetical protein